MSTQGRFTQTDGRIAIRARVAGATAPGLQTALWMWPADVWGSGTVGEIDIAEMYSQYPDRAIPTVHYWEPAGYPATNYYCLLDPSEFHEYVLEWTPERLTISYDGEICLDHEIGAGSHFDQDYFVVLSQQLGIATNAFDPQTTPLPASTVVDYVRIWR